MTKPWAKAHLQWANAKAKSFTYAADAAEDVPTTSATNAAPPAATEKPQP